MIEHLLGLVKEQGPEGAEEAAQPAEPWSLGPDVQGPPATPELVSPIMAVDVRQERTKADIAEAIDLLQNVASPILGTARRAYACTSSGLRGRP